MSTAGQTGEVVNLGFSQPLLSLRGFAALMVVISHCFLCFKVAGKSIHSDDSLLTALFHTAPWDVTLNTLIITLTNSAAAVTFFFVHSGFVLTLSLDKFCKSENMQRPVVGLLLFYLRRLLRLQPMITLSVLLNSVVILFLFPFSGNVMSHWFMQVCNLPAAILHGWPVLLTSWTIGFGRSLIPININPVLWSMQVELRGSALIPFMFLLYRRVPPIYLILGALGLFTIHHILFFPYMGCFLLGLLLTGMQPTVQSAAAFIQIRQLAAGIGQWFIAKLPDWVILISTIFLILSKSLFLQALFSCVIIFTIYYIPRGFIHSLCKHVVCKYLGEISYSIYILHILFVRIITNVLSHSISPAILASYGLYFNLLTFILCAVCVIPLSHLTFTYIEQPFMRWGKTFSRSRTAMHPVYKLRTLPSYKTASPPLTEGRSQL